MLISCYWANTVLRTPVISGSGAFGWAGRGRTYDVGVKVPCLTAWPQPNKKAPHGTHQREARGDACRELHLASKLDFYLVIGLGAARRTRTLDLLLTRQPLYQLSYDGMKKAPCILHSALKRGKQVKPECSDFQTFCKRPGRTAFYRRCR